MDEQNIRLQQEVKQYVHSMGCWYKFFAIVGIVGASFMLLCGIGLLLGGSMLEEAMDYYPFPVWVLGVFYIAMAGVEVPMIVYLMRAARAATRACGLHNNERAAEFMRFSKKFWKYYGILSIVLLGFCLVALPAIAVAGVAAAV